MSKPASNFEHLVTILSVAAILAIGFTIADQLMGRFGSVADVQSAKRAVKGYTRPGYAPGNVLSGNGGGQSGVDGPQRIKWLTDEQNAELLTRFQQGIGLLHAQQYDYAITALDHVIRLVPNMPEAYVNIGFAYLGMEDYVSAQSAFEKAIDLRTTQVNAYYGLAAALDGLKDYEAALGAMRTFVHLSKPDEPYLAKARAAIWEFEGLLGRIPGVAESPEGMKPQIENQLPSPHSRAGSQKGH
jgi:tetratricopeptide (TPR) repeat protein